MREWVTIDVADALELLSPDFRNPEVWGGVEWRCGMEVCWDRAKGGGK